MMAAFWAGIPVEVTQETGVVPCCTRAEIRTLFNRLIRHVRKQWAYSNPIHRGVENFMHAILNTMSWYDGQTNYITFYINRRNKLETYMQLTTSVNQNNNNGLL